jgi:hypothetical protein
MVPMDAMEKMIWAKRISGGLLCKSATIPLRYPTVPVADGIVG